MSSLGADAPLWVIRPSTLDRLSTQLGERRYLVTDCGHLADWRGVAELAGLAEDQIRFTRIQRAEEPFKELFSQWKMQPGVTVKHFWEILEQVERYDVLEDNLARMEEDIHRAEASAMAKGLDLSELNRVEVANREEALTLRDLHCLAQGKELPHYDAFVLYGETEEQFVLEVLVPNLEAQGLSVLVKDRDLLGGTFEHSAVMRLISERCSKLVPVFSQGFFTSEYNTFLATFAQTVSLDTGMKKVVPLVRGQCHIPSNLSLYHKLPYDPTKTYQHSWFWSKLVKSLHPTGEFNEHIPMRELEGGMPEDSAPKPSRENTPETSKQSAKTPVILPKELAKPSPDAHTKAKTPHKSSKLQMSLPKFRLPSSPFSRKSDKSKPAVIPPAKVEPAFSDLCSPSTPLADEEEEEGVNESGELLLPSVPSHEPGVVGRVMGRLGQGKARKYGGKQAESVA